MSGSEQPPPQLSSIWQAVRDGREDREPVTLRKACSFTDLPKTFLSSPNRSVDYLEKQLSSARVEDKDGSIDGLCG